MGNTAQPQHPNFLARTWAFLRASALRIDAVAPLYWAKLKRLLNKLSALIIALQPEVVNSVNDWLHSGLVVTPWMTTVLRVLAGAAVGARLVSSLAVNEDKLPPAEKKELAYLEDKALKPATEP